MAEERDEKEFGEGQNETKIRRPLASRASKVSSGSSRTSSPAALARSRP